MPRKRKASENDQTQANGAGAAAPNGSIAEPAPKKKRASRHKKAAAAVAGKPDAAPPEISEEAIRLRAYFIAEERLRLAQSGDAASDWIEARRQLLAERGES